MAEQIFPTKGNLIKARKTLALCRLGYDLMDRKQYSHKRNDAAYGQSKVFEKFH